jgi:phosphoenolpyruvate carboxylase
VSGFEEATDAALGQDVRELAALLGEVIREQAGEALFDRVEAVRQAAVARRHGEDTSDEALSRLIVPRDPAVTADVVRAFAMYFHVVNVAERVHRIRRRREYARRGGAPQPQSIRHTVEELVRTGVGAESLLAFLSGISVHIVFTAHPSESMRRALLDKYRRVAARLLDRLDRDRGPFDPDTSEAIRTELPRRTTVPDPVALANYSGEATESASDPSGATLPDSLSGGSAEGGRD